MEFCELMKRTLIKLKPRTNLFVAIKELRRDNTLLIAKEQEVCLEIKSVVFFPCKQSMEKVEVNFDPIKLSGDTITELYQVSIYHENEKTTVSGAINWKHDHSHEIVFDSVLISSFEVKE